MNFFDAVILGIIEGLTEFLPISSTGHLILASEILRLESTDFLKSFEIAIQLGAILSVVALYWRSLFLKWEIAKRVAIAFLPTAILGFVFYKIIKQYLLGSSAVVLWALFLGGIFLIIFERLHKEKECPYDDLQSITYKNCFLIGFFQAIAIVPGVSRAAATIIGGLALGLGRRTIVEFSFLLAAPTMLAATGLDLIKSASAFVAGDFYLLAVGFIISFITAMLAIKFLLAFIKKHNFVWFGVYRIILAAVFWIII